MSFTAQITANIDGFSRGIDQAVKEIDGLQKAVEKNLDKIGKSFEKIGKKASIFTAAFTVAVGAAYKMGADFEDALGATDQIFKESSEAVKEWANGLKPMYGIAKKEALEYSNLMGSMLINIGKLSEEQAQKTASNLIELAGDLTAMYGGSTQDAVRALTGALKGNNTMLDNYGMAVNEALIKTKALEMGLISQGQELSLQAKQAATLALIYEQTGAAQGQAAREADGASGSMRSFRTEVTNLATEIGEVLLPIITPVIAKLRDVATYLRTLSPEMMSAALAIGSAAAAIGPMLLSLSKLISLIKFIPELKLAFAALTGPIGLVVAAIAGAAALIISNWDEIKAYFTSGDGAEMFAVLKSMAIDIKNEVIGAFNIIKNAVTVVWDAMGSDIIRIFTNTFNSIATVVETLVKTFRNVAQILTGIFNFDFKMALDGFKNLFVDLFNGISRIVLNSVSSISGALAGLFDLVGLDKWAESLRSFSERLAPSMDTATQSIDNATESLNEQASAADESVKSLTKLQNVSEVVKNTSDEIATLTKRLQGLRSGAIASEDARKEIEETEEKISALTKTLDLLTGTTQKSREEQKKAFVDGGNIYDLVRRTSDEIVVLNNRLEGLRNGTVAVKNVHKEIEKVEERVKMLSSALDTLTGGRNLTINMQVQSTTAAWNESDLFKNMKGSLLDKSGKFTIKPEINTEILHAQMKKLIGDIKVLSLEIGSMVGGAITEMMHGIGSALTSGENIIESIGKTLIKTLGNLASQLGQQMIAFGTAGIALKKLIMNPYLAIAAGAALIALGAAASAAASKTVSGYSGGGYSGGTSSYNNVVSPGASEYRGQYTDDFVVTFVQKGDDLVGVLDTAQQRRKRI